MSRQNDNLGVTIHNTSIKSIKETIINKISEMRMSEKQQISDQVVRYQSALYETAILRDYFRCAE